MKEDRLEKPAELKTSLSMKHFTKSIGRKWLENLVSRE
jgi:hypothetical protein